jgi:sporulation protein YabP
MRDTNLIIPAGQPNPPQSSVSLQNRSILQITGVEEVISYHEREVLVQTTLGLLRILGESLQMERLSVESKDCLIKGQINGMLYEKTVSEQKQGFWSKIFR